MKTNALLICMLMLATSFCQLDTTTLNYNNTSAFISNVGTFFYDYEGQKKGYEVPKGSGKHALKSLQFWFAAKDENDIIHFSQGGTPDQGRDIFSGPISNVQSYTSPQYLNDWEKPIWSICQSTIDTHVLQHNCYLMSDCDEEYPITAEELNRLYTWPAHGDLNMGQSFYLAPFYSNLGNDGFYNPTQGDVPVIKGCCAAYIIQNDEAQPHTLTYTDPIGIELHIMFYQYTSSDFLNDATFVEVKAINYSGQDYPEFAHSVAVNAAIGNETDDFFGSEPFSGTMFFYNADNNDEDGLVSLGYGENPPAIGIVGLRQKMTSSVPYSGSETVAEKWNLMKGFQANGNPWMHPDGYESKFAYSGNPSIPNEWSELTTGNNPGYAQGLLSLDFGEFKNDDTLTQTYAIIYAREGDHLHNVDAVINNVTHAKTLYANEQGIPCTGETSGIEKLYSQDIAIAPNPSSGKVYVYNSKNENLSLSVFNLQGKSIQNEVTSNESAIEIDLQGKEVGVYFVHIRLENKRIVKRVVLR